VKRALLALALFVAGALAGQDDSALATPARGYALVAFGVAEQCRVLLAVEGDALLVDRDGNGELTDDGERILRNHQERYVTDVAACDAEGRRGRFRLTAAVVCDGDGQPGLTVLSVNPVEDIQGFHGLAGRVPFAARV
jgi:hypothetical protein